MERQLDVVEMNLDQSWDVNESAFLPDEEDGFEGQAENYFEPIQIRSDCRNILYEGADAAASFCS